MISVIKFIDITVKKTITAFCAVLLLLMVAFTVYSVVMRYVFRDPPIWGDLLTVLSNIWLVFFALVFSVRDKDHIALDMVYNWLPLKAVFFVQQFWTAIIFCLGIVMIIWGLEAVATMGGKYWEMWYFAWEDGGFAFKPNYMPKKYAIAIVPISGFLVCMAAIASIIEDSFLLKTGNYRQSNDLDVE